MTALGVWQLDPSKAQDYLVYGSPTSVEAYGNLHSDVHENRFLYRTEDRDGAYSLAFGNIITSSGPTPLVMAGGRGSILGFDIEGNEVFWAVASDKVNSIAFTEQEGEFMVGTDDYNISHYRNEDFLSSKTRTDKAPIVELIHTRPDEFACGLRNGKIGYYKNLNPIWAIRGSRIAISLLSFDATGNGILDLIVAAKSLEVIDIDTGKSLKKSKLSCPAKLLSADLKCDGSREILVCHENGKVLGLVPKRVERDDIVEEDEKIEYEEKVRAIANETASYSEAGKKTKSNLISSDSDVVLELQHLGGKVYLKLRSTTSAVIKLAIIQSESIEGGSLAKYVLFRHNQDPTTEMIVPLEFSLKNHTQLLVKSLIGLSGSSNEYTIVEKYFPLTKFYTFVKAVEFISPNFVQFITPFDSAKITEWLQTLLYVGQVDLSRDVIAFKSKEAGLSVKFDRGQVMINKLTLKASSLEIAQDIVQEYCAYFKITELDSQASFEVERNKLSAFIKQISQLEHAYRDLTIGMADDVNIIKAKVVQAEDCRIQKQL